MQSSDQHSSQPELGRYSIKDELQSSYNQCSTEQQIAANLLLNYSNQNYANNNVASILPNHHVTYDQAYQAPDVMSTAATRAGTHQHLSTNHWNNNKTTSQHKLPNILQRQRIFSDLDVHNYALSETNYHPHYRVQDDASASLSSDHLRESSNVEPACSDPVGTPIKSLKFVAVHLGAGTYSANNHEELKRLAKEVCENVMRLSRDLRHGETTASVTASSKRSTNSGRSHKIHRYNSTKKTQMQESSPKSMDAVTAAAQLIKQLEDHHLLNCGFGSNLNMKGHVECDASLMSDRPLQLWTGIGAISGCKNPILLAKHLYDQQTIPRPLQLVQPNLLVGQGAKQWMREHCPQLAIGDSQLISPRSLRVYSKLKSQYDETVRNKKLSHNYSSQNIPPVKDEPDTYDATEREQNDFKNPSIIPVEVEVGHYYDDIESSSSHENSNTLMHPSEFDHGFYCRRSGSRDPTANSKHGAGYEVPNQETSGNLLSHHRERDLTCRLDTVGAVAIDCDNNIASAISSGGVLLKYNGRVGQAAIPGAGCWAQRSIGVTTSGVGEYLTVTLFAKKIHERLNALRIRCSNEQMTTNMINQELSACFEEELLESLSLSHVDLESKQAGFLAIMQPSLENGLDELLMAYGHNTNSMCIGFMSAVDMEGHSRFSTKPIGDLAKPGQAHIETVKIDI